MGDDEFITQETYERTYPIIGEMDPDKRKEMFENTKSQYDVMERITATKQPVQRDGQWALEPLSPSSIREKKQARTQEARKRKMQQGRADRLKKRLLEQGRHSRPTGELEETVAHMTHNIRVANEATLHNDRITAKHSEAFEEQILGNVTADAQQHEHIIMENQEMPVADIDEVEPSLLQRLVQHNYGADYNNETPDHMEAPPPENEEYESLYDESGHPLQHEF